MSECVGCGYCCIKAICWIAAVKHGVDTTPCPELKWNGKRYKCKLMLGGKRRAEVYKRELFAGEGCCSGLNDWRRDVRQRRGIG